jgi:hypothetical protein
MYKYKQKTSEIQHREIRCRSSACVEHASLPVTFPASNDLQKPRTTLNEARYANCDPHAQLREDTPREKPSFKIIVCFRFSNLNRKIKNKNSVLYSQKK